MMIHGEVVHMPQPFETYFKTQMLRRLSSACDNGLYHQHKAEVHECDDDQERGMQRLL